ncbi:MAG: OmpA family protein [Crocinitomicaceae bacterium]|nr:OmpA family protein [Crocinitomicaceae bacterium]
MKKLLFIIILALPMISFGQSRQVWVHHADEYFEAEDFYSALLNYEKAWSDSIGLQEVTIPYEVITSKQKLRDKQQRKIDTSRQVPIKHYIQHQIAACHLRTFDYDEAVVHFEHTSSFKSYPEDVYNYAVSQMNVKNHKEAVLLFEQYIKSDNYSDSLLRSAQLLIKGCFYAMDENNFKKKIEVKMLDTTIFNRGTTSFAPAFFGSENKLMFTSARNGGVIFDPEIQESAFLCDLYWTEKDLSGNWSRAINYGRPLNSAQHEASSSYNKLKRNEEQSLIFYTKWNDENRLEQSIYFGRMVGMKFYESFKLPVSVNVPGFKSINPFVSLDETTLFFSSNRPGGLGGMDLWKIQLDETGNVAQGAEAINLGRPINSELDEVSPFYHEPSSTLFFSSNGHNSIGGLDIFKSSYYSDNKAYGTPVNMGMPINSSMDDSYIIWDALMEKGYFASDRAPCENGHCYDIYEITNEPIVITLEGFVFDIETDEILPNTNLNFKDINSTIPFENRVILTDENGFYKITMDKAQQIYIMATRKSYFAAAESVTTMPITKSTALMQDFYLGPIGEDEIELDGIEYGFDSSALRLRSKEVLDELYAFLMFNGNLVVEINSHTDSRGSSDYNRGLAERRAKSCVDYLISKGIPKERLIAKGYGEDLPNFLKNSKKKPVLDDEGKRIYLKENYIKAQPTEEVREEYHQRNRRTAFKVVGEGFNMESL